MNPQNLQIAIPDRDRLAVAFLAVLESWLTPEQRRAVAAANATEKNPNICHTHDVCDANQAMIDAWERAGGGEIDCQDDAQTARMSEAWRDVKGLILRRWLLNQGAVVPADGFTVKLSSRGNPDYSQDPLRPLPGVPDMEARVGTVREAVVLCREYIRRFDLGGGNWTGGEIVRDDGLVVGRVSYNGRVWDAGGKEVKILE